MQELCETAEDVELLQSIKRSRMNPVICVAKKIM